MMEAGTVALEGAHQSVGRTATVVEPAGERTQVLHLLGRVFHNKNAGNTALRLGVEGINVDAVHCRHRIYFVSDGIPAQRTFGIGQLASLAQHVFHQEVSHVKTTHAVTVMVDISPTATVSHTLVGNMVVHGQELLPQLIAQSIVFGIQVSSGYALHQVEIVVHLHAQLGEHILVPAGYHTLVSLGLAYHEDGQTAYLAVLISDLIEIVCLADGLHFLIGQFAGRIEHVAEAAFHQSHICLLLLVERCQGYFRLPKRMLVDDKPVVCRTFVDERHLHIGRLLAGIYLAGCDNVVEVKLTFHVGSQDANLVHAFLGRTLHVAFVAHPCGTPAGEVNAKGERCTEFAIFQKFETYLLVLCLLVVYPHDESRQISVLARRVFLFEHQVFLHAEYGSRLKLPAQTVLTVFVMLAVDVQPRTFTGCQEGGHCSVFERKQPFVLHHLCLHLLCRQEKPQKRSSATRPFAKIHHCSI